MSILHTRKFFSKLNVVNNLFTKQCNFSRGLSCGTAKYAEVVAVHEEKPDWNKVVSEAEKIVGYPTSFLNLRWLLSDEIANVALHLRKLVGTDHPLLKTAKNIFYNGKNNMHSWGLIVLLFSKAAGHTNEIPDVELDKAAGVLHSQRALAEVAEMMRTSHLIHKGLLNITHDEINVRDDMVFGNKIALLSGDYLLSNSCTELAELKNQELVELMSSAVRDLAEAEFVGPRDGQNNPLPAEPKPERIEYEQFCEDTKEPLVVTEALGNARAEWTLRCVLNAGSLLGKSCQGTLKLAGHDLETQKQGYLFGKHLALTWQACLDAEPFTSGSTGPFNLVSAPVMFHLQHDPSFYSEIEKGKVHITNVDYDLIREAVLSGPALEMTRELQHEHAEAALGILNSLPESDARNALIKIIAAM